MTSSDIWNNEWMNKPEIKISRKKRMHPSLYINVKAFLETRAELFLLFYPSYKSTGKLSPGKAKALFQYCVSQRKREWNTTVDVVLLPYANSQTYARDYFNCKGMAASPVLRRKGILFTPDCLQGQAHINKGPQHFQKSGQACSGRQLACPPLSLGAGVTAMAEGGTSCSQQVSFRGFSCHGERLMSEIWLLPEINLKPATVRAQNRAHVWRKTSS